MERQVIPFEQFAVKAHARWAQQWMLLVAGDFQRDHFNAMTVGWGSFGTMWKKPFAQVVVRPTRYTYEFMEQYETFTLCGFPEEYQPALEILGTKSGRDGDKIAEAKLTPIAASRVAAPGFQEADLIVECRKIYWEDFTPEHFLEPALEDNYPLKDYHRVYFGEILAVSGTSAYRL
ncbi:flavin reductase family protein [candidate division KSB3 bacterium]|uniref:Flavin reductase family protein n=1 Tax=candidate division KSB3 bacterium TaxID=2044937 RepID=A0A9D5Q673_9BACT|nr:flavin reductase family protein [candidate division KSB3 bacterium]MBD3324616.1 flavin reductase family protein [candidate division KSB3 bacterium]